MKTHQLLAVFCFTILTGCSAGDQSKVVTAKTSPAKTDPEVIAKLEEIVALRSKQWESFEIQLQSGRVPLEQSPIVSLCEARIRLAQEKGEPKAVVIQELEKLVAAQQSLMKDTEALAKDRLPAAALDIAKIGLLEAQIRLRKEQTRIE